MTEARLDVSRPNEYKRPRLMVFESNNSLLFDIVTTFRAYRYYQREKCYRQLSYTKYALSPSDY